MRSLPRPASLEWSRPRDAALLSESGAEPKPQPRDEAKALLLEQLEAGIAERTLARSVRELDIAVFKETDVPHRRWMITLPAKETNPIPAEVVPLAPERPKETTPIPEEVVLLDSMLAKETTPVPMGVVSLVPLDHEHGKEAKETTSIPTELVLLAPLDEEQSTEAKETNPIPEKLVPLEPAQPPNAKETTSLSEDVVPLAADDPPAFTPKTVARYVALVKDPPGYDDPPDHAEPLSAGQPASQPSQVVSGSSGQTGRRTCWNG